MIRFGKFLALWRNVKSFWQFLQRSGKVLYVIWQNFYNKSEFFSVVIFKYNLAIWSHWLGLPAKSRQTMGQYDKVTEI